MRFPNAFAYAYKVAKNDTAMRRSKYRYFNPCSAGYYVKRAKSKTLWRLNELLEVDLTLSDTNDGISLKKPSEVYYEIYKAAREKAKHMKKVAIEAHLEARNIKTKYMLDDLNISEDEFSNYSEIEE